MSQHKDLFATSVDTQITTLIQKQHLFIQVVRLSQDHILKLIIA
jgi:hypothetical protein